uniref:Uncharacterized protein n=1 Tax=Biomphalaria glabrata TaxID=6526 RepID=A0A2C9M491_BIOGL
MSSVCFVLLPDSVLKTYQKVIAKQKLCPEVQASYPSQLFFHWMLGLMITGFKREIKIDDVFDLNPRDQGRRLNPLFDIYWDKEVKKAEAFNKSYFPE